MLDRLDFNDGTVQHVVLASVPSQGSTSQAEVSCTPVLNIDLSPDAHALLPYVAQLGGHYECVIVQLLQLQQLPIMFQTTT